MATFVDWANLQNPILEYFQWSIKDACCIWREGLFHLYFSAFDQERSHVGAVTTMDFRNYSDFVLHFDGRDAGYFGMCSPHLVQVDDVYYLTFNSWGNHPARPNQLFYIQSKDLLYWSERQPLAAEVTRGARAIDAALACAGDAWFLIFKREQLPAPFIATAPAVDGPWRLVGKSGAELSRADGQKHRVRHENFQFMQVDGRWRLLCTDYLASGGISHHPYLYTMRGTGEWPEDWLDWRNGRQLEIPVESFNSVDRDNAAALSDWRKHDGYFYLIYAGKNEGRLTEFAGLATARPWPRGWNKLGLARSRDLVHWSVPGMWTIERRRR